MTQEDPPFKGRPDLRISLNTVLYVLLLCPVFLMSYKDYVLAAIAAGAAFFANHYVKLAKYNLKHIPRMRVNLYIEWPVSYLIVFFASFLSEDSDYWISVGVILYQMFIQWKLAKLTTKSYRSSISD